jgi:hypothetical protein
VVVTDIFVFDGMCPCPGILIAFKICQNFFPEVGTLCGSNMNSAV